MLCVKIIAPSSLCSYGNAMEQKPRRRSAQGRLGNETAFLIEKETAEGSFALCVAVFAAAPFQGAIFLYMNSTFPSESSV